MKDTLMEINLPYLHGEPDRFGVVRMYVRRFGRRIRIREVPGTPAFLKTYQDALKALERNEPEIIQPDIIGGAAAGTVGALARAYFASMEFRKLDRVSQSTRRQIIEQCLAGPVNAEKPGSPPMAEVPVGTFSVKHVRMLRDRKADKPGAANNRLKYLSAMYGWALETEQDGVSLNPAQPVKSIQYASDGFHTWTREEVAQFEARHPIGTKARLALALLLFTGARRGDVVTFGRQHIKDGWLRYVPRKTRYKRVELSQKPVLPVLADIINQSPVGDLTFLVTHRGLPFTANGFGNWFRERCDEAGLGHCTAHGLKKAGATMAADGGATVPQLQALFDWHTIGQAQTYIEKSNRKKLAGDAARIIGLSHSEGETTESETRFKE